MGSALARNWLRAGRAVRVWNRTASRAKPLADDGAVVCGTPAEAVAGVDTVVTMLFDAEAVAGAIIDAAPAPGTLWVQTSTVGVAGAQRLAALAAERDLVFVDAPVVGTRQPAEQGTLTVLASGPDEVRGRVEALCGPIAARVRWLGAAGTGSRLKLVLNSWLGNAVAATGQALALADGLGVQPRLFLELIEGGPLDMAYAHLKGGAMLAGEYPTAFPLNGAAKNMALVVAAAGDAGVDASLTAAARDLFAAAADGGHAEADMAAVYEAIRVR
ncbi:3-hydroxyisobutyrate dehydrogenase [Virgisporangium aliadipatigenens]|uniref:3-hydroxyisobutyrate dehydrogenase n=2 Tax=Virgisporangium aliadipatigenens TaxID=741659 RepID=A0A8J4DQP8_9ACTN|nr:3-hydroxyisobutyrate dehydrogenase [Virgisporangium aliadipatigenens]